MYNNFDVKINYNTERFTCFVFICRNSILTKNFVILHRMSEFIELT